ncbi:MULTISPECIES: glycosyltransferase family A protein [Providencia]|uniref:glycosyltransferase family A protein n=1 Tax=Providencia TaxID=586 RepID=UPI00234B8655|nr:MULTISPECIES: glycosyltransferase family A protein [unclassified Providencia]
MIKIEIAISTLNDGIHKIHFNPKFNYLIVHQINNNKDYSHYERLIKLKNIRYIKSHSIGLSKSRNLAIKNSDADYIWIMDDDVKIDDNAYDDFFKIINSNTKFDMLILSHSSTSRSHNNKAYSLSSINRYNAMSVSSIDMLLNRKSIIDNKILFNENFGLGTNLPSGEEFIFTTQMLKKKLKIYKTNIIFSYHPPIASGHDFYSDNRKLKAKLAMFTITYGETIGRFLFLCFIIKKIKILMKKRKILSAIHICFSTNRL